MLSNPYNGKPDDWEPSRTEVFQCIENKILPHLIREYDLVGSPNFQFKSSIAHALTSHWRFMPLKTAWDYADKYWEYKDNEKQLLNIITGE